MVGDRHSRVHQLRQRPAKALGLPVRQAEQLADREQRLNRQVAVEEGAAVLLRPFPVGLVLVPQASTTSSLNQNVKSPRFTRASLYRFQFLTS